MAYTISVGLDDEHLIELPTPAKNGLQIDREAIWSDNTTRDSNTDMTGTLLSYKWKLMLKWNALTQEQARTILTACCSTSNGKPTSSFKRCHFTDPFGSEHTITAYCGTLSYTTYSWVNGKRYLRDVSIDIIEK